MKSKQKKQNLESKKPKNLFDHLEAIRGTKDLNYYSSLNEKEKSGFNHWAILHGLSMDMDLIEPVSYLWRDGYYNKIPPDMFYRLLVDIVPQTNRRLIWIKKSKKQNEELSTAISKWYSISMRESGQYLDIFMSNDGGLLELSKILEGMGYSDSEAESLLVGKTTVD